MRRRNVLVVTNMYPSAQYPGFGTFVEAQVKALRARGLNVDVLMVSRKKQKLSYIGGVWRFWRCIHRGQYDLIHAHYVFSGMIARLQFRYPLLVSFHGGGEMVGWVGLLCKLLAPLADAVTVTSPQHKAQLGRKDAYIIPCGVDLELFVPMPKEEARERLGLPLGKRLVLFAGDMRPEKRLDIIRDAVDILRRNDESTELVIATSQPHELMPLYMNACDVLALASDYEGSPVVIKEAMACNLPIVSVEVGDVAQIIRGTEGCYICNRDPKDMAQKLKWALDRGQRTEGRHSIRSFGLDATVDSLLQVYAKLWR